MQFKTHLKSKLPLYLALGSLLVLASCGSYQYVGSDSDGIYGSSDEVTYTEATPRTSNNNGYYKEFFGEKSQKYANIANDDNVIFTNIDDYEGNYSDENGDIQYEQGYAGWGQSADNVNINVYSDFGWNNFGFWNRPWGYGNGWFGYDWYGGFYNPFWYPGAFYGGFGYFGGGFYNPYFFGYNNFYNGFYGNNFYRNNNIAFNAGRRGSGINTNNRTSYRLNNAQSTTRNTSMRNGNTVRRSNNSIYNPSNSTRNGNRINSPNARTNSSGTRVNSPTRRTSSESRVNTPTRSTSSPTVRSSGGSSRSSGGATRSSGGGGSRRGG